MNKNKLTMSNRNKKVSFARIFAFSFLFICILCLPYSCKDNSVPRPYGYFRVDIPEHSYNLLTFSGLPYRFNIAEIAEPELKSVSGEKYWIDINYPRLNANIHCSYKEIKSNFYELSEDSRKLVYSHSSRADNITERFFEYPGREVFGVLSDLKGNVASPVQFVLTDSINHFFRGALYFDNVPNKDSIAPMVEYIRTDIIELMESFEWTK